MSSAEVQSEKAHISSAILSKVNAHELLKTTGHMWYGFAVLQSRHQTLVGADRGNRAAYTSEANNVQRMCAMISCDGMMTVRSFQLFLFMQIM